MLVSGVRSSCEASATNWRWRASALSVSVCASASSPSMSSSVRDRSAISSSARNRGRSTSGSRVFATRRAASRQAGDRLHRAPRDRQAGEQGERAAAEHARARGTRAGALIVAASELRDFAYWTYATGVSSNGRVSSREATR